MECHADVSWPQEKSALAGRRLIQEIDLELRLHISIS
jgi:hypothetical protein